MLLADVKLPDRLAQLVALDATDPAEHPAVIAKLLEHLNKSVPDRIPLPDVECPYRGLEVFTKEHAHLYFGRDDMVRRLVDKLKETNCIAIVGPSGSGKSSLVQAGLLTALANNALPNSQAWDYEIIRPGRDPVRALLTPLIQRGDPSQDYAERLVSVRKVADALTAGDLPLSDLLDPLRDGQPVLLLIIDQFEEAFTLSVDDEQEEVMRNTFFQTLLTAADQKWIKVVLTLRADFWGWVLDDELIGKPADSGQVNVLPMTLIERQEAIEQPAHNAGRRFQDGLVGVILADVAEEPGQLPLLEFALTELWSKQVADGLLTHDAYNAIGKVSGAIAQHADATLVKLNAAQVCAVFTRLVQVRPTREGADVWQRIALKELLPNYHNEVQQLITARLLVTGTDPETGQQYVEIAYEALIRSWATLQEWLDSDRKFLLWRLQLQSFVQLWSDSASTRSRSPTARK